jgi:hypothetical protein
MKLKEPVQLSLNGTIVKNVVAEDSILVHIKDANEFDSNAAWWEHLDIMHSVAEQLSATHKCTTILVPKGTKVEVLKFEGGQL